MRPGLFTHKFVTAFVAIVAIVAGAVAIARPSADTNISRFAKAQPAVATCPKIAWPYGCEWRPPVDLGTKRLSARKNSKHDRPSMAYLAKPLAAALVLKHQTKADRGR
jgi:hypothetical protein